MLSIQEAVEGRPGPAARLRGLAGARRTLREIRSTLKLALPIMAGMIAQMLMGLADTIMVGQVGVVPLAASAFVNAIAHLPFVFSIGLVSSVGVLTSQAFGARDSFRVGEMLRHGLLVAAAAGLGTAGSLVLLSSHLHCFKQPEEIVAVSGTYLILFGTSLFPAVISHAAKQFCEALNRPWIPNLILLGGVVLNVALNWLLIYGNWGFPALGLNGAGWATLIARSAVLISILIYLARSAELRGYRPAHWLAGLSSECFRRLLGLGGPVALQHLLEVGSFVFAALMAGWVSAEAIAAHQIAVTCAATTFMLPLGIGMASCVRVGHAWGAGQLVRMRRIGWVGLGLVVAIMTLFAAMFVWGGETIASQFIKSQSVVHLAVQLLLVAAVFQIADGAQIAAICALRGLNDVKAPMFLAMFAYWGVTVPLAYGLAFWADLGAVGIWIGLAVGLGLAAASLAWRFHLLTRRP